MMHAERQIDNRHRRVSIAAWSSFFSGLGITFLLLAGFQTNAYFGWTFGSMFMVCMFAAIFIAVRSRREESS